MRVTEIAIKGLKSRDKSYITADSKGLCLQITTNGSKLWRYHCRYLVRPACLPDAANFFEELVRVGAIASHSSTL